MRKRRFILGSALTFLALLVSSVGGVSPAQAYDNLDTSFAEVDTDNCDRLNGSLNVIEFPAGCRLNDSADDTFFLKDAGGEAAKIEVYLRNGPMVGKVEFHPYGERLLIYDTRNDGDSIYVRLCIVACVTPPFCYGVTGTSNPIDVNAVGFDIAEGKLLRVEVYDDSECNERITSAFAVA
jgi:hypothetical protein